MLSNSRFAVRLSKYRPIIILIYEILILTIFYIYNGYNFENNSSIIFIIAILIVPIVLSILTSIIRKENQIKYRNLKTNYDTLIKEDILKGKCFNKFIEELKNKTSNVIIKTSDVNQLITIGKYQNITILIDQKKTVISIDKTNIVFQYIYGYIDDDTTKYDQKGISNKPLDRFYNLLLKRITSLLNNEFSYEEYYFGRTYNGCKLSNSKETIYKIKLKEKSFLKKEKTKTQIINT